MEGLDISKLSDRELLLLMHERQAVMGGDVKELKEGTSQQLTAQSVKLDQLEIHKADKGEVESLKRQVSRLNNYLWFAFGALAVLQIVLSIYLALRK